MNVLLIEPTSTSYPPLGLMKISRYHKLLGDKVKFVTGNNREIANEFWDKIYITSVFTYDYKKLKKTIEFYSKNLFNFENMIIGGIAATLLYDKIEKETGARVHRGLLNTHDEKLKDIAKSHYEYSYLLDSGCSIDNLPPDYSIFDSEKKYTKIIDNAFFLYSTKGCPNKCDFCAVKILEPDYISYINIKSRINILKNEIGDRHGLIFLDNNIAASSSFDRIIDEIIECGFGAGEKMEYQKNGRTIKKNRFVDFNQGVDLRLLNKDKMRKLSKIAIDPLRLAFDDIKLANQYINKTCLAIENGIKKLSNYMLYNHKDSPVDLYRRMEINTEIVKDYKSENVKIFSFPMRYSPVSRTDRSYVGKNWTKREIRALQLILQATHGIVSHSLSKYKDEDSAGFFYRAFGNDSEQFSKILLMPFNYIINRDKYEFDNKLISIWMSDYEKLSDEQRLNLKDMIKNGRIDINQYKGHEKRILKILEHYEHEHSSIEED